MKLLKDLIYKCRIDQVIGSTNVAIEHLSFDSRNVEPFSLFVAVPGTVVDGHDHISGAIESGAVGIICQRIPDALKEGVTYVRVPDSAVALATIAANYHDHPSARLKLIGVTGTNGKTSVTTMLFDLFRAMGHRCGLISTVEQRIQDKAFPTKHTTPDPVRINELLAQMVDDRVKFCFMEVSSHAVVQHRVTGLQFAGGVFMNITHDHLDYHGTFDNYIKAKKGFFDMLPESAFALVNVDDNHSEVMVQNTKAKKRSFGVKHMADHKCRIIENQFDGLHLNIDGHDMYTRLIGSFNASNILAVYSVAVMMGGSPLEVLTQLSTLEPVRGRFQIVKAPDGVVGIVDYAHTPDALKNVLTTIRDIRTGEEKVITIVGCGGDRDRAKRPQMAKLAAEFSDSVILTSDNPRTEDPQSIIDEMKTGLSSTDALRSYSVVNRREAISMAANLAGPGDVILLAGKGHETYQEINGVREPFDDVKILSETLQMLHS